MPRPPLRLWSGFDPLKLYPYKFLKLVPLHFVFSPGQTFVESAKALVAFLEGHAPTKHTSCCRSPLLPDEASDFHFKCSSDNLIHGHSFLRSDRFEPAMLGYI